MHTALVVRGHVGPARSEPIRLAPPEVWPVGPDDDAPARSGGCEDFHDADVYFAEG